MRVERLPCLACERITLQRALEGEQVSALLDAGVTLPTFPIDGIGSLWLCTTCRQVFLYLCAEVEAPAELIERWLPARRKLP